jgi:SnoaL-like domain
MRIAIAGHAHSEIGRNQPFRRASANGLHRNRDIGGETGLEPLSVALSAIDEIFHEDGVFYDPKGGIFRGRDEIDRIAGVIKATHPDFEYQPLFPPEELGDAGRVRWVSGTPGKPPAYAGTDFIVARNGRIAPRSISFSTIFLKPKCATSSETLDDEWQSDFWMLTA